MLEMKEDCMDDILRLEVSGTESVLHAKTMWNRVNEAFRQSNIDKILVIDRMHGELTPLEILDMEKIVREEGIPYKLRLAIVDLKTGRGYNDSKFAETIAINRGWTGLRIFRDEETALEWLNKPVDPQ